MRRPSSPPLWNGWLSSGPDEELPLCPNCGKRRVFRAQDWCATCKTRREAELAQKRAWWHANRGADADTSRPTRHAP